MLFCVCSMHQKLLIAMHVWMGSSPASAVYSYSIAGSMLCACLCHLLTSMDGCCQHSHDIYRGRIYERTILQIHESTLAPAG
jgi:hypothetical protein